MHELSIARDLVDLAVEEAARAGASRVVRIKLRLGALAGVIPPALRTAFEAAKLGTPAGTATLEVEDVAATVFCTICQTDRAVDAACSRRCPVCRTPAVSLITGEEMELSEIEIE